VVADPRKSHTVILRLGRCTGGGWERAGVYPTWEVLRPDRNHGRVPIKFRDLVAEKQGELEDVVIAGPTCDQRRHHDESYKYGLPLNLAIGDRMVPGSPPAPTPPATGHRVQRLSALEAFMSEALGASDSGKLAASTMLNCAKAALGQGRAFLFARRQPANPSHH